MRFLLLLILQLILFQYIRCTSSIPTNIQCNEGKIIEYDGHEYQFFDDPSTWEEAKQKCEVFGGSLVTIHSSEENELCKLLTDKPCWFGVKRTTSWGWVDDSSFCYTNWFDGNFPSDNYGDCGLFNWNSDFGKWGGLACVNRLPYICKRTSNECSWESQKTGAPSPIVKTEFDQDNNLSITIEMADRQSSSIDYALRFAPITVNPSSCSCAGDLYDTDLWDVEHKGCSTVFSATMSLSEFVDRFDPSVTSTAGSDFVLIQKKLRMVYFDSSDSKCNVAKFETDLVIRTILIADSSVSFELDGQVNTNITLPPSFVSLSNNDEGRLVVDVIVEPGVPGCYLKDFTFFEHSKGIDFQCTVEQYCVDSANHIGCKYRFTCVSESRSSDYCGELILKGVYIDEYNRVREAYLKFHLEYALVDQPQAVVDVIGTTSKIVDSDLSDEVSVIQPDQTVYLLTETTDPIDLSQAVFSYEDVYLCCTKNMQTLEAYAPSQDRYGCTRYNSDTMSFWTKLVSDGQPQSSMDVQIRDLGPFVNNKLALEFKPNGLEGEDRLCYIHVKSDLSLKSNARSITPQETSKMDSTVPLTFKSCSSHSSKKSCLSRRSQCSWRRDTKSCTNRRVRNLDNAANGVTQSPFVVALVAAVGLCAAIFM